LAAIVRSLANSCKAPLVSPGRLAYSAFVRCYMIAVAQGSSLDRYSNNFSLFLLLEQFRPSAYPARLAVFSHAFFEVDAAEAGVEHEVRLLVVRGAGTVFSSEAVAFKPTGERHRVRISGLVFPEPGLYRVMVEWRVRSDGGDAWTREAASWPIRADVPLQ
jgi:hypothetical protein